MEFEDVEFDSLGLVLPPREPWYEKGGGKIKRGADKHYDLMKTPAIVELLTGGTIEPLDRIRLERSALFMWVTNNFLEDGLLVMKAMGYRYITNLAWGKTRSGTGYYFHGQHELCLFGVKGKWPRLKKVSGKNSTLLCTDKAICRPCKGKGLLRAKLPELDGGRLSKRVEVICPVCDGLGFVKSSLIPHRTDENGKRIHSAKPLELQEMIELRLPGGYLELFARNARPGWAAWGNEAPKTP
jgi:N6-adenosine-specific RNA methylase IME4